MSEGDNRCHYSSEHDYATIKILEARIVLELRSDLELAAYLIPQLHGRLLSLSPSGTTNHTGTGSSPASHSTSTLRTSSSGHCSIGSKRKQGSSGQDDEDTCVSKRTKSNQAAYPPELGRPFACHFHKRWPTKYCARRDMNLTQNERKKWRSCAGPGYCELRRIK